MLYPQRFSDADKIHMYCEKCGYELEKQLHSTQEYHRNTGKEKYNLKLICCNKKHFWEFHTSEWITRCYTRGNEEVLVKAVFDKNGNEL